MANNSSEGMGQTKSRGKSQFDEVCSQPCFWRNHPKVGHNGKTKAAADSGALNGGNHRRFRAEQSNRLSVERVGVRGVAGLPSL